MRPEIFFHEPSNRFLHTVFVYLKRFMLFHQSFRLCCSMCKGKDEDGSLLKLVYIGEGETLKYIQQLCFSRIDKEQTSRWSLWNFRKAAKSLMQTDAVLFLELNRLINFLIPVEGFITFPWVRQKVCLDSSAYRERKRKINEVYARKTRKYGHRFRITRNKNQVVRFYTDFYVPYVTQRFKNTSSARSLKAFKEAVNSGFLLQVYDKEDWISGAVCRVGGNEVTALAFGLRADYQYYLHQGALSSVYYFLFKWAEENALETVDLLRSRPNTGDGVFEHKRRWGAMPEKDPWPHTAIRIYLPERQKIPSALNKQLVWYDEKCIELQKVRF